MEEEKPVPIKEDIEPAPVEEIKPSRAQEVYSFGNSLIDDLKRKMYEEDERNRKSKEIYKQQGD